MPSFSRRLFLAITLATLGAEPGGDTPQAFRAFVSAKSTRWGNIIKEKGVRPE